MITRSQEKLPIPCKACLEHQTGYQATYDYLQSPQHVELCYHKAFREKLHNGTKSFLCSPGDYLDSTHIRQLPNDTCTYHSLGNHGHETPTFVEKSQCGYSKSGKAFCDYREGDELHTRTLKIVEEFWRAKPNCHVNSPFGCDHAMETPGYYKSMQITMNVRIRQMYIKYYVSQGVHYELHHSRYLQDNDACVKEILHAPYWKEYQQKMQEELAKYYIEPNDHAGIQFQSYKDFMQFLVFAGVLCLGVLSLVALVSSVMF